MSGIGSNPVGVRAAITAKDKEGAKTALAAAISQIDKSATKGVTHPKAASRTISRLASAVHKLG